MVWFAAQASVGLRTTSFAAERCLVLNHQAGAGHGGRSALFDGHNGVGGDANLEGLLSSQGQGGQRAGRAGQQSAAEQPRVLRVRDPSARVDANEERRPHQDLRHRYHAPRGERERHNGQSSIHDSQRQLHGPVGHTDDDDRRRFRQHGGHADRDAAGRRERVGSVLPFSFRRHPTRFSFRFRAPRRLSVWTMATPSASSRTRPNSVRPSMARRWPS